MSVMRSTSKLLATGALVVALGVAVGGPTLVVAATDDSASEIEGAPWILEQLAVAGELTDVPDGVIVTLLLDGGLASGGGGCNNYSGAYVQVGSSLTFGPLGSTAMLCPDPAMATETSYLANLGQVTSFETDRAGLHLLDGSGAEVLAFEAGEVPSMEGSWIVSSFGPGDRDLVAPLPGALLTAVFGPDGTLEGSSGCNRFTGSYAVDGSDVSIGALSATKVACPSPELQQQETDYLASLAAADRWSQDGTYLELADSGGVGSDTTVTFTATIEPSYVGSWDVTGFDMGNGSIVTPSDAAALSAVFSAEGTIEGNAGCNAYTGPAIVSGSSMTIGPLATTFMACPDSDVEAQEAQFLVALQAVTTWAAEADGLVLRGVDGATLVTLAAAEGELRPSE